MNNISHILLIRLSSLGDILLTYPVVSAFHQQYPQARIDFLVKEQFEESLSLIHNYLTEVIALNKSVKEKNIKNIRHILKKKQYDLIVDLQNNLTSRWLVQGLSGEVRRYRKHAFRRWLFVNWRWPVYPARYVSEKYALAAGIDYRPIFFDSWPVSEEIASLVERYPFMGNDRKPRVIIFPGAKHGTKRWPVEYFSELIRRMNSAIGGTIILHGDGQDRETVQQIHQMSGGIGIPMAGETSIRTTMAMVSLADLIITHDSAAMHMAALFRKPQVVIWGSTTHHFGFRPEYPQAIHLENSSLSCRPCSHLGYEQCPLGHFRCMKDITPSEVWKQIQILLKIV